MATKTEARRQAILKVAAEVFQELGYERASMSEICARVGGSKATLYNYFPSKEELFYEVVNISIETEFEAFCRAIDPSAEDIAASLRSFGERFLSLVYSPYLQANRHLIISESGRSNLGRLVYERRVVYSKNATADKLLEAMNLGKLRQADPGVATQHLYSLLESELMDRFLFQLLGEVSPGEIQAVTARAIDVFMAAYGATQDRV